MLKLPTKTKSSATSSTRSDGAASQNGAVSQNGVAINGAPPHNAKRVETPRRRKRNPKALWALYALMIVGAIVMWRRSRGGEEVRPEVRTAVVERGDVRQTVSSSGTLQAFNTVDVKSKAGGTVLRMAVEEGTRVRQGQLIAVIDRQDTSTAYRQAIADANAARAALRQAEQNARLQEAGLEPQIAQGREGVATAQARLKQARENLALESGNVAPQIAQSSEAVASARARLRQAEQSLAVQRTTAEADVSQARSNVATAQARLEQAIAQARVQPELSRASVAQAQAGVASAQANVRSAEENLRLLQSATQPQERASAQAGVQQAQSDVETAQTNMNRLEALLARGFVAQNAVDTARNQLVAARSSLQTAQARLDTLREQQASQTRDAQARLSQSRGALNQAQAALRTARGNTVQTSLRDRDVTAARAALRQAQAGLNTAVANRRQVSVRLAEVEAARASVRQAEAALSSTRSNTRQVQVRAADVESAQAAVRQAEAALRGAQTNRIQVSVRREDIERARAQLTRAEVAVQNARENLQQTRVVAPRNGIVLKKYVDQGTIIQSGQSGATGGTSIVQLANVDRIYVDVKVDEADIALIEPGQNVDIALDAYPASPKAGRVRKVFPEAQVEQNVTYVRVQVEIDAMDVDERLRPGMNATCDFLVEQKENTLTVPTEAVKDEENATTVTVIKDPKKPLWDEKNQEKKTVEVGVRGDESTEITSGLKEGQTVVTQIIEPVSETTSGSSGGSPFGGPGGGRGGGRGFR